MQPSRASTPMSNPVEGSRLLHPSYLSGRVEKPPKGGTGSRERGVEERDHNGGHGSGLYRLQTEASARDTLTSQRPSQERRYSGEDNSVDFEATLQLFELVTNIDGVTDRMKFLEIRHYFKGAAAKVVGLYESEKDPAKGLKRIKKHLIREFGSRHDSAQKMMEDLLNGKQISTKNNKDLYDLILALEGVYRKAKDTNKEKMFDNKDAIEAVIMRRAHALNKKWTAHCAKKSMEDDVDLDDSSSSDEENKENKEKKRGYDMKFIDLIKFLRFAHRHMDYDSSYNKKVSQAGHHVAAAVVEDASSEEETKEANVAAIQTRKNNNRNRPRKPAAQTKPQEDKKPPPRAQWKCNFCNEEKNFHHAEDCEEFKKLPVQERIKEIRKTNRCLNCLKPSHVSKNCTRPKCATCGRLHHILLHPEDEQTS